MLTSTIPLRVGYDFRIHASFRRLREIERSLPHGHVAAVLGALRAIGLDRLLPRRPERLAKLALALIVARVVEPAAKLFDEKDMAAIVSPDYPGERLIICRNPHLA